MGAGGHWGCEAIQKWQPLAKPMTTISNDIRNTIVYRPMFLRKTRAIADNPCIYIVDLLLRL